MPHSGVLADSRQDCAAAAAAAAPETLWLNLLTVQLMLSTQPGTGVKKKKTANPLTHVLIILHFTHCQDHGGLKSLKPTSVSLHRLDKGHTHKHTHTV